MTPLTRLLPIAALVATLGSFGGCTSAPTGAATITSDDGRVTLEVPADAGVDTTTITIKVRADAAARGFVFAYDLEPSGLRFAKPATFRWRGPLDGLAGSIKTDGISWADVPLVALRSYANASDPAPEALATQQLALNLDDGTATLSGTLAHFTDVAAEAIDHEKLAGRFAVGFMGIQALGGNVATGSGVTPIVGLRYWINQQVGVDPGLGLAVGFDSVTADGQPLPSKANGTSATLTKQGDELRADPPAVLGSPLRAGVPIAFAARHHYAFQTVPPIRVDVQTTMTVRPFAPCSDTPLGQGGLRLGPEANFAMIIGLGLKTLCATTKVPSGLTLFSTGATSKAPEATTDILLATSLQELPWHISTGSLAALYYFSVFHCGVGELGYTVCPNPPGKPLEGDFLGYVTEVGAPVPTADPSNRFVFSFVFDGNDNPNDNYRAPANYPKDFYDDTDRWYEATYAPTSGWVLTAKDAHGPTPTPVTTNARLVIQDSALMLLVPAVELATAKPRWRATSFRHKGDYGLSPPYDWSGDVVPPVGQLATTP